MPRPGPAEDFAVRELSHDDVAVWYHVFCTRHYPQTRADTFSEGWGDTRFAPILNEQDIPVHTYYLASTAEAAFMESILHDVCLSPPGLFELPSLKHFHLARIRLPHRLRYVSFHSPFLPRLGLERGQLIDTLAACYPQTRCWSQAAYRQCSDAQAIGYGSRRDDAARCLMLFRDRLPSPPLEVLAVEPLASGPRRAQLLSLVRALKLHEV
ncbi:MAG: RES domain-containing protein [Lautropia sp.]|nr:RES domain-containing protein [Lautropia sp.]